MATSAHRLVFLLAAAPAPLATALPATYTKGYTHQASALSEALLDGYVKSAPPLSTRSVGYSEAGTDVKLQLRFFKLESVAPSHGNMRLKVWLRMAWKDERLSWDPSHHGGIKELRFHASSFSDPETSDIWLPDITAYNGLQGFMHTFDPALATVQHDGSVYWSRPGMLDVMCRFSGLASFPYGNLSCPIELGGWALSGAFQGIEAMESGCSELVFTEETSLASYTEYAISRVECSTVLYKYPCCPNEPWPVMKFRVHLQRTAFYYLTMTLLPICLFTFMSFAVFFMSFQVGERLGFGVTLCLVSEVSKTIFSAYIPVCGELLWIELYLNVNLAFTGFALLESCIVLGIAYNTEDYLVPPHVNPTTWGIYKRFRRRVFPKSSRTVEEAGEARWNKSTEAGAAAAKYDATGGQSAVTERLRNLASDKKKTTGHEADKGEARVRDPATEGSTSYRPARATDDLLDASAKLLFFENLFFRLDPMGQGFITVDDARRALAFTSISSTPEEFEAALFKADSHQRDGKLDRGEFVDLCTDVLWSTAIEQLEGAAANYAANEEALVQRRNTKWRRIANNIDRHARFWLPCFYAAALIVLFGLDMDDKYTSDGIASGPPILMSDAWNTIVVRANNSLGPLIAVWFVVFGIIIVRASWQWLMSGREKRKIAAILEESGASSLTRVSTGGGGRAGVSARGPPGQEVEHSGRRTRDAMYTTTEDIE